MSVLNIEYLSYLCQFSLTVNNKLLNLYNQYIYEFSNADNYIDYNYCDDQLNDFLINLIDSAEYWGDAEKAKDIDDKVLNYFRLSDLIHYMHHIDFLKKKHEKFLEESFLYFPKLNDYQFEDSRLVDIKIDNSEHICKILLRNVLFYGEKRINKRSPVDTGSLYMIFHNTKEVDLKGRIFVKNFDFNIVKRWHIMETQEKQIRFCLMTLIGSKCFLIQIVCSDIELEISN